PRPAKPARHSFRNANPIAETVRTEQEAPCKSVAAATFAALAPPAAARRSPDPPSPTRPPVPFDPRRRLRAPVGPRVPRVGHTPALMSSASGRPAPSAQPGGGISWLAYALPAEVDVHDELLAAPDTPRPHWTRFVTSLGQLGPQEMARRWEQARRLLRENGVTYNVYGDPRGADRPWELDPLPLLLAADEWRSLEAGPAQRAQLLNLVLAALYGPQRLLHDGLLPAELLWAHPGFLRPCHGVAVSDACWLHLLAVDLARAPDGVWWALADRTQAPSGAGYALENRIVLSRTLPELFRDCRVQRLAGFFGALRDTLRALAPRHRENPRVVL